MHVLAVFVFGFAAGIVGLCALVVAGDRYQRRWPR